MNTLPRAQLMLVASASRMPATMGRRLYHGVRANLPPAVDPVVIVNPRSGGGLSTQQWGKLVGPLTEGLGPFQARFTEGRDHARQIAREEALTGRPLVIAFGGDGTISEVADGLLAAGTSTHL